MNLKTLLGQQPVMPVLVIERLEQAVPLARCLAEAGLPVLEITLRTAVALKAITLICEALPALVVGAGTVLNADDMARASDAGAQFLVSPGSTNNLLKAATQQPLPWLPGVSTASEAMTCLDHGFTELKLFPAEAVGGVRLLKSLAGPLPQLTFCPTGGIASGNAASYLALGNVVCIGGSWMATPELLRCGDWTTISTLASAAARLRG